MLNCGNAGNVGLPNLLADLGHNLSPEPDGDRILLEGRIVRTRRFSFATRFATT
jgi:hypothetical protein